MRFLVDECAGHAFAEWLRREKHEVFSVYDEARGMDDDVIIQKAFAENWMLITNDKDFGEKIYREKHSHHGVVLLPTNLLHLLVSFLCYDLSRSCSFSLIERGSRAQCGIVSIGIEQLIF